MASLTGARTSGLLGSSADTPVKGVAGPVQAVFNFMAIITGGGLLGWPATFQLCGWLGGIGCLALMCFLAEITMRLMVNVGVHLGTSSYEATCRELWGAPGFFLVALACFFIDFGVLVSYWVALGDMASPIVQAWFPDEEEERVKLFCKLGWATVMLPFCYARSIAKLPGWSYVLFAFHTGAALAVVSTVFAPDTQVYNEKHVAPYGPLGAGGEAAAFKGGFWPALGTLAFTYVNHDSVFLVFSGMKTQSREMWRPVCMWSMWCSSLLTAVIGIPAYLALGDKTQSDITLNLPASMGMNIMRGFLAVSIAMTWVYLQQVGRKYFRSLAAPLIHRRLLTKEEIVDLTSKEIAGYTTVLFAATLAVACVTSDLGLPMAVTGVFAQSLAGFIIPPAMLLTLARRGETLGYGKPMQAVLGATFVFGLVAATYGVYNTVQTYA